VTFLEYIRNRIGITNAPSSSAKIDPKKTIIKRLGLAFTKGTGGKKNFEEPVFDLEEITKAYNTDSYIRQAIDKYVDLMFKADWDITGKNQNSVDYIKIRLTVMSEATQTPIKQFLLNIAEDLVKYGNSFLIKARAKGTYLLPAGVQAQPITGAAPIAGYFVLPPTTIKIARDEVGTIVNYQQNVAGKTPVEYKPEDIIHIAWKKERGQAFGVPFLIPVLDDVKILRQMEEDVIRLVYRHLFPLHQYQVGIDKPGFEASDEEIELVREQIRNMPLDGGIVVPERHNITVVGSQGEALDVEGYLEYFRKRVFTGMGVSETVMGIGDSSNRSTAESMTTEMHDRIKAFQRVMAEAIDYFIIRELLQEGGFDPLTTPDDDVDFNFKEIDLDMRTKLENNITQLWLNNLITFEEARQAIGRDPVADESRLYLNVVGATETTTQAEADVEVAVAKAKATPKAAPAKKKTAASMSESYSVSTIEYHEMLQYHWELTRSDVIDLVKQYYVNKERTFGSYDSNEINGILHLTRESMQRVSEKYIRPSFIHGVDAARVQAGKQLIPSVNYDAGIKEVLSHQKDSIIRLLDEDLNHLITVSIRSATVENAIAKIMGAFQALNYRLEFIANSELYTAYNYGFIKCAAAMGIDEVEVVSTNGCDICSTAHGNRISTKNATTISQSIPPLHPNCTCILKISNKEV